MKGKTFRNVLCVLVAVAAVLFGVVVILPELVHKSGQGPLGDRPPPTGAADRVDYATDGIWGALTGESERFKPNGRGGLKGAGIGASTGAAVGSIVPGLGTAIGAVIGAGAGAIVGLFTKPKDN